MKSPPAGHRELEHTADWELEVWGSDMPALFGEAACGMYELMGVEISEDDRYHRQIELLADDREQLLVSFLGELLFLAEAENLAFDGFLLEVDGTNLLARLEGGPSCREARRSRRSPITGSRSRKPSAGSKRALSLTYDM